MIPPTSDPVSTWQNLDIPILIAEVLHAILQFCPSLTAFHLHYSHWSSPKHAEPWAFWCLKGNSRAYMRLLQDRPLLTILTIDYRTELRFHSLIPPQNELDKCPSTIEHLTLIGSTAYLAEPMLDACRQVNIDDLFHWVSVITTGLKTVRFCNGFKVITTGSETHSLNDLLLKFRDTLEQLEMNGTGQHLPCFISDILGHFARRQQARFGSGTRDGILSCLSEMAKLRHLAIPIHYLRDRADAQARGKLVCTPKED